MRLAPSPPLRSGGGGAARQRRDGRGVPGADDGGDDAPSTPLRAVPLPRSAGKEIRRRLPPLALTLIAAAMLMWTAVANGRPAVFSDTALYYGQAEYLFQALGLVGPGQASTPPDDPTDLPARPGAPNMPAAIDGARSPLYGAGVYALQRLGGLWLVAFAQAWAVAAVVWLLVRAVAPAAPRSAYLALMAGLAVLSPLPFFAAWIMPDVLAGVAACGLLLLLVYPDGLGRAGRIGAGALTAYGLAAHRSNLLDAVAVIALAAALLRAGGLGWPALGRRIVVATAVVAIAVLASALAYLPIRARAGEPIGSPPFLSARVIGDGPGRVYLRRVCTARDTPFALCAFRQRPLATSDQILWSPHRRDAVFVAASPAQRRRMAREDTRFALSDVLALPMAQARASASNVLRQFVQAYADDPLRNQGFYVTDGFWRRTSLPRILPDARACAGPHGCPPRVGEAASWTLEGVGLAASLAGLAWRLSGADVSAVVRRRAQADWRDPRVRLLTLLALTAGLLVANALVCGALSGPFPRYQARLIWLIPLAGGLTALGLGPRRRRVAAAKACEDRHLAADVTPLDAPAGPL